MTRNNNKKMEKNLNVRLTENLLDKYKKFCNKNGYSISKRIRNFIEKEIKNE
jgi:hypothetical protein